MTSEKYNKSLNDAIKIFLSDGPLAGIFYMLVLIANLLFEISKSSKSD